MDIRVPNLGDGIASGTIVAILVKAGDKVNKGDTVLEVETDKAVAPIPADAAGTVEKILVAEGAVVKAGQVIMQLAGGADVPASAAAAAPAPPAAPQVPSAQVPVVPAAVSGGAFAYTANPVAPPEIRRIAKQIGLDLGWVSGTGNGGRITFDDFRDFIARVLGLAMAGPQSQPATSTAAAVEAKPAIDFSKWGKVKVEKMPSLRQTIARNLVESWQSIPHVTQHAEVDMTAIMSLRAKYKDKYDKKGAKLTVTVFIMRAVTETLKKFPQFNASINEATNEFVFKEYFNLGIAVDTPAGLIVPVIKGVDEKNLIELSKDLSEVAEKARARKVGVEDLRGGTFTISNLGGLGGTYFTPIVNKPEVAILGLGQGKKVVRLAGKSVEEYLSMPISLSYDHRIIDGADGARFISTLVAQLESFDEKWLKG